jgi:hypothetical protein
MTSSSYEPRVRAMLTLKEGAGTDLLSRCARKRIQCPAKEQGTDEEKQGSCGDSEAWQERCGDENPPPT